MIMDIPFLVALLLLGLGGAIFIPLLLIPQVCDRRDHSDNRGCGWVSDNHRSLGMKG